MSLFKLKTPYSIRKVFIKYFLTLLACILGVLIFYCVMFITASTKQLSSNADATLDFYLYTLQSEMSKVSSFQQQLCYTDSSFRLLTMKNLKDSDKVVLQYNVSEMLKRHVAPYECIFIFNADKSISMYAYGSSFFTNGSQFVYQLKNNMRDYWLNPDVTDFGSWIAFQDEHHSVLMNTLKVDDIYVCTTIDLNKFDLIEYTNSDYTSLSFGFFNQEKLLSYSDFISDSDITVQELNNTKNVPFFSDYYIKTAPIEKTDISMFCVFSSSYMWSFTQISVIVFILIAIATCAIVVFVFISFNKILLYPIERINAATNHLEQNDSTPFITNDNGNIIEYENINNAVANLINQKIILNKEKQKDIFEKDHARLQYYYVQTRSHFFVNCLKTLYNMLESGEYEKMRRMMIAFSNHLRYIFNDNLKLVSLESELIEVNDYYNIILLDRQTPIVLNCSVDKQLYKYQVPPLLIQTFFENTAKYNKQSGNLLIFDVKISLTELDGIPVMQIHLSDNGIGYTAEVLEQLNSSKNDLFARKHVGISNLKHRIALIYKKDYKFAFYNNPNGGACALIYLPLLEALAEE